MNTYGIPEQAPPKEREEDIKFTSYIERVGELDQIIQRTPMSERAESNDCQIAQYLLTAMRRPRFHVCRVCGNQYGNDQTVLEIKCDADIPGICARCGINHGRMG